MTLTDFLLARIAEDEAEARLLDDHHRRRDLTDTDLSVTDDGPALRISPARVLAECEAKRRIVEDALAFIPTEGSMAEAALLHLAAIYVDHPDYDEEWKP